MFISEALAQTTAPAADSPLGGLSSMLLPMLVLVLVFFMMVRPQMRRQKEAKAMLDALAKGDEVVTAGGVIGRVTRLGESILHVEIASGVEIQIQRTAVAQVLPKGTFK